MRRYSRSSDRRFRRIQLPWVFDALRDFLKFKDSPVSPYVGKKEIFNRSPLRDWLLTSIWHFRIACARLGLTHREIRDCEAFAFSSKCFAALLISLGTTVGAEKTGRSGLVGWDQRQACTIFSRRAVNYLFLPSICIELGIADAKWQNI